MKTVWHCGRKVTSVPPRIWRKSGRFEEVCNSASILIWLAGFPTDFLVVRFTRVLRVCVFLPWLLYRFPHGRFDRRNGGSERWLPADFPAVGCERRDVLDPSRPARDYALSAMAVEW